MLNVNTVEQINQLSRTMKINDEAPSLRALKYCTYMGIEYLVNIARSENKFTGFIFRLLHLIQGHYRKCCEYYIHHDTRGNDSHVSINISLVN